MQAFVQTRTVSATTNVCAKHAQTAAAKKQAAQAPFARRLLAALLSALAAPNA